MQAPDPQQTADLDDLPPTGKKFAAARRGDLETIERAGKTVRNMRWFEVSEIRGHIDDQKIGHWKLTPRPWWLRAPPSSGSRWATHSSITRPASLRYSGRSSTRAPVCRA